MSQEPTIVDVLEAVQNFSTHVDARFDHTDIEIRRLKTEIASLRSETRSKIESIKTAMVTKSYLDDKIADLRGDLVLLARKGNTKLSVLIEDLERRNVLDHETAQRILALEPFPS